ncbi:MAG: hypothetical protein LBI34_03665 [Puniceicoccales bacterium]|jgi:hypothetical protein|nr:hypothetical protein [Puniceicoccales bacterium]
MMEGNAAFQLVFRLVGSCVTAFALDNAISHGSFLLGMVPLLPLVFFINLPFEKACAATFIGGLLVDSTYLSIPFGVSAIGGIAMLLLLKIFHIYFNREIGKRWLVILIIYTVCYYILLSCILPFCYVPALTAAMTNSIIYNCLLWMIAFYGCEIIYSPNMRIRCM